MEILFLEGKIKFIIVKGNYITISLYHYILISLYIYITIYLYIYIYPRYNIEC